jgi:hypothetical protein
MRTEPLRWSNPSPQPNGFPSPPQDGFPTRDDRFAKRGPTLDGEREKRSSSGFSWGHRGAVGRFVLKCRERGSAFAGNLRRDERARPGCWRDDSHRAWVAGVRTASFLGRIFVRNRERGWHVLREWQAAIVLNAVDLGGTGRLGLWRLGWRDGQCGSESRPEFRAGTSPGYEVDALLLRTQSGQTRLNVCPDNDAN